jgi:beta-galactosidase
MKYTILLSVLLPVFFAGCAHDASFDEAEREISLDGKWKFKLLAAESDAPSAEFWKTGFDVSRWDVLDVPSCWEMKGYGKPLYDEKISGESGLYVRHFELPVSWPSDGCVRLRFEGVMFGAKVWVNGHEAADFTSSFNEHEFDITAFVDRKRPNTIAVRTHAHPKGAEFDTNDDWTLHGIYRSVAIVHRPQVHLAKWRLSTRRNGNSAEVSLEAELSGEGSVEAALFGPEGALAAKASGTNATFSVANARFWSAETPDLYKIEFTVRNRMGKTTETFARKVGLKEVTWNGSVLKVNGMPVKLRGVNHHDLTPGNGRAVTAAEQRKDAELIKAANANFIRTSHYPPSKALLDACDEIGIYVMDEVPFGLGNRFLDDESYGPILKERVELTLARDINRACVIAWSVGNENHITPITLAAAKRVKELDPTRPWCFPMQPRELIKELNKRPVSELGDFANWHYPAICGEPAELKEKYFPMFNRPYISGEYAHAYGLDFGLLEWYWSEMMWNDPSYAGGAVWMFHDQGILRKASDMTEKEKTNCVWPDPDHVWDSARDLGTDGVVYSDRTPQTDYFEMRKVYSPIRLGDADVKFTTGGRLELRAPVDNRFDMLCLDNAIRGDWKIFANRRKVASGEVSVPKLAPHSKGALSISADVLTASAAVWLIEIDFYERRTGRKLYERSYPLSVTLPEAAADCALSIGFDAAAKAVVFRGVDGAELLRSPILARVDRRPMLSKDRKTRTLDRWTPNALEPASVKVVESSGDSLVIDAVWKPKEHTSDKKIEGVREISGTVRFKVDEGAVRVDYSLRYATDRDLVETGLALELPARFRRFDWVGQGPYECYPLASMLSEFGIWAVDSGDLRFSGNRQGVHLVLIGADDGRTAAVIPGRPEDVVFERRGDNVLVGHNAFVAGKACKFNVPRAMGKVKAGEKLEGSFRFVPPVKSLKGDFGDVFGPRKPLKPFMPFYKAYDI